MTVSAHGTGNGLSLLSGDRRLSARTNRARGHPPAGKRARPPGVDGTTVASEDNRCDPREGGRTNMTAQPRNWILLSVLAAIVTLGLKAGAYGLTGSVGLLSDAM